MNNEKPKIFQNYNANPKDNNNKIFYGDSGFRNKTDVDDLFKQNEVYRTNVKITLKDRIIEKKIIGRTKNNLITLDNEIIPIENILQIETI